MSRTIKNTSSGNLLHSVIYRRWTGLEGGPFGARSEAPRFPGMNPAPPDAQDSRRPVDRAQIEAMRRTR